MKIGALLYPERGYWRPTVRSQCANIGRPCPYVACKHHLYLDMTSSRAMLMNFPDAEPWDLEQSCTLDLAEHFGGGMTLEQIGHVLGVTRERVWQLEASAIAKVLRRISPEQAEQLREYLESRSERQPNWDGV